MIAASGTRLALLDGADTRRSEPRHTLPLRPAGQPVAATRSTASRSALSYADPFLFAAGGAVASLRQLAAGSPKQLRCPTDLSRAHPRNAHRSRSGRRDRDLQPVRLLSRTARRETAVRLRRDTTSRTVSVSGPRAAVADFCRLCGTRCADARRADDRFPG